MKIFWTVLDRFYVPRFSDLEQDYSRQENVENEHLAAFVGTWLPHSCWLTTHV